jgi:hypothetical protein
MAARRNRMTPKQNVPRRTRGDVSREVIPTKNRTVARSTVVFR